LKKEWEKQKKMCFQQISRHFWEIVKLKKKKQMLKQFWVFKKKTVKILVCEIEADKVNNSLLVSLPSNLRQKAQEFQIDKQSKVATQKRV